MSAVVVVFAAAPMVRERARDRISIFLIMFKFLIVIITVLWDSPLKRRARGLP